MEIKVRPRTIIFSSTRHVGPLFVALSAQGGFRTRIGGSQPINRPVRRIATPKSFKVVLLRRLFFRILAIRPIQHALLSSVESLQHLALHCSGPQFRAERGERWSRRPCRADDPGSNRVPLFARNQLSLRRPRLAIHHGRPTLTRWPMCKSTCAVQTWSFRDADFGRFRLSWQWRTQTPISNEHSRCI